jgi:uncharacterized protein (TIGR03067 family)
VIDTQRFGYPGDDESYSLATFDTYSKAYGRWSFRANGSVMQYGGLWDEENQTLKWHWAGKDGSQSSNIWPLRDANRRDWQVVTKNALGKTIFEVQAISVRQKEAGWTPLFNGKNLTGWVPVFDPELKLDEHPFRIHNEINNDGIRYHAPLLAGAHYLRTKDSYENYTLKLEYRANDTIGTIRAALKLHLKEPKEDCVKLWITNGNSTSKFVGDSSWWGNTEHFARKKPEKEWNELVIVSRDGKLEWSVNGEKLGQITGLKSAFGHIALDGTSIPKDMQFRNLSIRVEDTKPPQQGFQPLFNGKDMTGWEGTKWKIEDGVLLAKVGSMRTTEAYENYELKFRYKIVAESKKEGGAMLDLHLNDGASFVVELYDKKTPGFGPHLTKITGPNEFWEMAEPPGAGWNDVRILCEKNRIRVYVNDQLCRSAKGCVPAKGKIALTVNGLEIEFRDIQIKSLPPSDDDLSRMQGDWIIESAEQNGKPADKLKGKVRIQGNTINFGVDDKSFTLDTSANPKRIDLIYPKASQNGLGIYRFDGDQLIICVWDGKDRPTEFTSAGGDNRKMMTLKRAP